MGIIPMLTALFGFLYELFKGIVFCLPDIMKLIKTIIAYFEDKKQREIDAQQTQITAQLQAASNQQKLESANIKAFKAIVEQSWQERYNLILLDLQNNTPENILILAESVDIEAVNNILFLANTSAEYKALQITQLMRNRQPT